MKQIQWESGLEVKGVVRETQGFVLLGAPSPSPAFIPCLYSLFPLSLQWITATQPPSFWSPLLPAGIPGRQRNLSKDFWKVRRGYTEPHYSKNNPFLPVGRGQNVGFGNSPRVSRVPEAP